MSNIADVVVADKNLAPKDKPEDKIKFVSVLNYNVVKGKTPFKLISVK